MWPKGNWFDRFLEVSMYFFCVSGIVFGFVSVVIVGWAMFKLLMS